MAGTTNVPGLTNVSQFEWTFVFVSNIFESLWSHSEYENASKNISNTVAITKAPTLGLTTLQKAFGQIIPPVAIYTYPNLQLESQQVGVINSGDSGTFSFSSYTLNAYPERMYVWASETFNNRTVTSTNTFPVISNLQFQLDGQSGINAAAKYPQLWQQARDGGSIQTFNQFTRYQGSVCCVDFTRVLPLLKVGTAPGGYANTNIVTQLTITNINPLRNINYTIWYMLVFDGLLSIFNTGTASVDNVVVNAAEIAQTIATPINDAVLSKVPVSWYGGKRTERFVTMGSRLPLSRYAGGSIPNVESNPNNDNIQVREQKSQLEQQNELIRLQIEADAREQQKQLELERRVKEDERMRQREELERYNNEQLILQNYYEQQNPYQQPKQKKNYYLPQKEYSNEELFITKGGKAVTKYELEQQYRRVQRRY